MPSALSSLFSIYLLSPLRGRARERASGVSRERGRIWCGRSGDGRRRQKGKEEGRKGEEISPRDGTFRREREKNPVARRRREGENAGERKREEERKGGEGEERENPSGDGRVEEGESWREKKEREKKTEGGELLLATEIISVARGMTRARTKEKGREKEEEEK